ncbi:MAG: NAD(P)H-hydrate dehydratase [Candidatus Latescibacteria bacterium]|nr:NAD(P)H-hydrate dehydratase [Candidatus Latescibacterota bacterium]
MFICTADQMRAIDQRAIDQYGIPGLTLMERAGRVVARAAARMLGGTDGRRVEIVCGKGNNGGDGFVAGRLLAMDGARVHCLLLSDRPAVTGDARAQLDRADAAAVPIVEITEPGQLGERLHADLIIDAILGTGLKGPAHGLAAAGIAVINRSNAPVLSVDVPSGLTADVPTPDAVSRDRWPCVRADRTVTIGLMKLDVAVYPGKAWAGEVEVADIGLPAEAVAAESLWLSLPTPDEMAWLLPRPAPNAHKGDRGRVVVVAGSVGLTGAAGMACQAALRIGAGMAMLGTPESLADVMAAKLTEVMTRPLPETPARTLSLDAQHGIDELLAWGNVLAIGPGLSRHEETSELVRRVVARSPRPMVIDADGLNAFTGRSELLASRASDAVITPHAGELSRLIGRPAGEIQADRAGIARQTARTLGVTVVLKGAGTVVADPTGRVSINPTGNPGMATAGSGDVLTGAIVGLMAQGLRPFDAAMLGVYLQGRAGDLAAAALGRPCLIAGDLIDWLPRAMVDVERG